MNNIITTHKNDKSEQKSQKEKLEEVVQSKQKYYLGSKAAFEITNSETALEKKLSTLCESILREAHLGNHAPNSVMEFLRNLNNSANEEVNAPKVQNIYGPTPENITRLHKPIFSALRSMDLLKLNGENIKICELFSLTSESSLLSRLVDLSLTLDIFDYDFRRTKEKQMVQKYVEQYATVFKDVNHQHKPVIFDVFKTKNTRKNKVLDQSVAIKIQKGIVCVIDLFAEVGKENDPKIAQILENEPSFIRKLKKLNEKINKLIITPKNIFLPIMEVSDIVNFDSKMLATLFFIGGYVAPNRKFYNQIISRDVENQDLLFKTLTKINVFLNDVIIGLVLGHYTTFDEVKEEYKKEINNAVLCPTDLTKRLMYEGVNKRSNYEKYIINTVLKKFEINHPNFTYEDLINTLNLDIDAFKDLKESINSNLFFQSDEERISYTDELNRAIIALNLINTVLLRKKKSIMQELHRN